MTPDMLKPMLIILSAPSGAGKTTLCSRLLATFPEHLRLSISSTTRAPRTGEQEGVNYFFVTKDSFQNGIKNNQFAEWAEVHGNFYGTSKDFIDHSFASGKSVLLDIDVQGADSLRANYPNNSLSIFISPPSLDILEKRLRARATDAPEVIEKRLQNAQSEMARKHEFDHVIVNDQLEEAYKRLVEILTPILKGSVQHG